MGNREKTTRRNMCSIKKVDKCLHKEIVFFENTGFGFVYDCTCMHSVCGFLTNVNCQCILAVMGEWSTVCSYSLYLVHFVALCGQPSTLLLLYLLVSFTIPFLLALFIFLLFHSFPLCFQAGFSRRWLNHALVFLCWFCVINIFFSSGCMFVFVIFDLVLFCSVIVVSPCCRC